MNKLYLLFLSAIFLFTACEYEPRGINFVELPPPEDNIPIEITLNDVNPLDTIFVYQNTSISIITNPPQNLIQADVSFDGKEFSIMGINSGINSGSFFINPDQMSEGVYKLTVNATFASGSGSVADLMGLEGYVGELSWNIYITHDLGKLFRVGYRTNAEGFLEIFWKNAISEKLIEKYTIHSGSQNRDITIDATQKSFVDYGYVCGHLSSVVTAYLKDGYAIVQRLSSDKPTPVVSFENLGLDKLRVMWNKPFANGRFNLIENNITIASGISDTTITLPQIFGKTHQFTLEIRPQKAEYDNFSNKFSAWGNFCQGTSLGLPNWPLYAYNKTDNIIYTTKYDGLVAFDATTLQQIKTVTIDGLIYGGKVACAPHNQTVAAMTGGKTFIYSDSRLINPIVISSLPGDIHTRLAALTSNDRFFVVQGGTNVCKIFNSLTGEKITEFPFTYKTIYDIPELVTVSEDGRYFCASSENGIEIFEISGTTTNLLYTDTRDYRGAMFIPSQPDKLFIRVGSNFEIHQVPGFDLIQTIDMSPNAARFCNIDPSSMNLLYHQNDSLKVCKIDNLKETIFKIRSDETSCNMLNNKLLTYGKGGNCFDISPYLSH